MAVEHHVSLERPAVTFAGMQISWGGVWAGTLVVLGALLILSTLGLAIGFSADARNVDPGKIGAGAVLWSRVSLLIALFLGGIAATRMSMVWDRFTGLAQGTLVWVVSLFVLLLSANDLGLPLGVTLILRAAQHTESGASATAWMTFLSVVLSLLSALAGSAIGQHRAARAAARARIEVESSETPRITREGDSSHGTHRR
ncbi:MAG TPA: hypothetical protein VHB68_13610 [Steroidobacteraceae bacterium]|nr:hypothetical protein [Steroidobacteraceae bacterium]